MKNKRKSKIRKRRKTKKMQVMKRNIIAETKIKVRIKKPKTRMNRSPKVQAMKNKRKAKTRKIKTRRMKRRNIRRISWRIRVVKELHTQRPGKSR